MQNDLWAVTCFNSDSDNPYRLQNYNFFRQHLNVPLLAVDLSASGVYQLDSSCAEILIQLRADLGIWQIERAINIGIQSLPQTCCKVVWIDSDIVFDREDWVRGVDILLDDELLIKPFSELHELERRPVGAELDLHQVKFTVESLPAAIARGLEKTDVLRNRTTSMGRNPAMSGAVWAARRELLERYRIYDACLLAGNDRAIACAAYGEFEIAKDNWLMNKRQMEHYLSWARPFYNAVGGHVGFLEGSIRHLWHGDPVDRKSIPRYERLQKFDFDPYDDLEISENGCWRWSSTNMDLIDFVANYFLQRERVF